MIRYPLLTAVSSIAILLMTLHVTDDIVRGISPAGPDNAIGVVIFVIWLYGTLELAGRRSGHVITLLGGLFAAAMPLLHMRGAGYQAIVSSPGGFFFVWTLFAVGVTGTWAVLLSLRALWASRHGPNSAPRVAR